MTEYLQLIGSDDPVASGSVLLWSEDQRVVFNCPEGMQRFAGEIRLRLTKVNSFFFTRLDPHSFMGFPGALFTVNDAGVKQMQVVGDGSGIDRLWTVLKQYFFTHRAMDITLTPANSLAPVRCGQLDVLPVPCGTAPNGTVVFSYLCSTSIAPKFDVSKAKALGVSPGPKYAALKRGNTVDSDLQPGRVVTPAEVCTADGVSLGTLVVDCSEAGFMPDVNELERRTAVQIHTLVHVGPWRLVSSDAYRAEVLRRCGDRVRRHVVAASPPHCRLTAFPTALANRIHLHCIAPEFVLLPPTQDAVFFGVGSLASAPSWIDLDDLGQFSPSPSAAVVHRDEDDVAVAPPAAAAAAVPAVPPPQWRYSRRFSLRRVEVNVEDPLTFPTLDVARRMLSDGLLDVIQRNSSQPCRASTGPDDSKAGLLPLPPPTAALQCAPAISAVHFYGTGSAVPSKYRNVSCATVEVRQGVLVLDAGEGSLGQMWNHWIGSRLTPLDTAAAPGLNPLEAYVARIELIFVSHFHADHHLGVFALLSYRRIVAAQLQQQRHSDAPALAPVTVMAPRQYIAFYEDMGQAAFAASLGDSVRFFAIDSFVDRPLSTYAQSDASVQAILAFLEGDATVFHVDHPAWALGVRLDIGGTSMVYSGDTQPCASVAHYSQGVDLLIHEATFAEGMTEEARQKRHSTVSEAISAGASAKALLLTHFSQRYPKLPSLDKADTLTTVAAEEPSQTATAVPGVGGCAVGVAFDLLTVPGLHMMPRLASYTGLFQALAAEYESWGDGTTKRLRESATPSASQRTAVSTPAGVAVDAMNSPVLPEQPRRLTPQAPRP